MKKLKKSEPEMKAMPRPITQREEEQKKLLDENEGLKKQVEKLINTSRDLDDQMFDLFAVSQASKALTSLLNVQKLSDTFVAIVTEKLDVPHCAIFLYDEKENLFRLTSSEGLEKELTEGFVFHQKEGLFWEIIVNGAPFYVVDHEGKLRFEKIFRSENLDRLKSVLWVPLKTKGRVTGILALSEKRSGRPFSENEMEFLRLLSGQAAVAFESATLYEKMEKTSKELDRQMFNLSILFNVGKAMNFINDLTKLLKLILDKAIEVTHCEKGSLMLLDEATNELVVRVVRGLDPVTEEKIASGEIQTTRIKSGEGVAGKVLQTGKPMMLDEAALSKEFKYSGTSRVNSILCLPLILNGVVIGVVNMTNKKEGKKFTQADVELMTTLADQAAVAINNAQLYELAVTDGLTKLFIHRYFQQKLQSEIRRSDRYNHKTSVIITDIDHFKKFNDTYGHQIGDFVLAEVARLMKKSVREIDICCRYGGEEFSVILPETDEKGAYALAERVRQAIEQHEFKDPKGQVHKVTISVGVSTYPENAKERALLIKAADQALYQSKEGGRNRTTSASGEVVRAAGEEAAGPEEIKEDVVKEMIDRDFLLKKKAS